MSWLRTLQSEQLSFDQVFGLRGDLHDGYRRFYALFWEQHLVDPVLLEVARLRIARLNGCDSETRLRYRPALEGGLSEEGALEALSGTATSNPSALDGLQRAVMALAEMFVGDVHSIRDEDIAVVRNAIGEPALVALVEAMALFDGFSRFRSILGVEADATDVLVVDAPLFEETAS